MSKDMITIMLVTIFRFPLDPIHTELSSRLTRVVKTETFISLALFTVFWFQFCPYPCNTIFPTSWSCWGNVLFHLLHLLFFDFVHAEPSFTLARAVGMKCVIALALFTNFGFIFDPVQVETLCHLLELLDRYFLFHSLQFLFTDFHLIRFLQYRFSD